MNLSNTLSRVTGIFVILSLTACGGGGGGGTPAPTVPVPDPDALVGGNWEGTMSNSFDPGVVTGFAGLTLEDGQGRFGDENGVTYEINISSDGDEISGTMRVYPFWPGTFPGGATVLDGTVTGTIVERTSVDGTWTASSGETGEFSLAYNPPGYEIDVTLAGLVGVWTQLNFQGNPVLTITIDADGSFNGQDINGCVYTGTLTDPASQDQFNGLLVDLETGVFNCPWVGNFSGLAGLVEDATDPDQLVISVDDDALAIGFGFIRQ